MIDQHFGRDSYRPHNPVPGIPKGSVIVSSTRPSFFEQIGTGAIVFLGIPALLLGSMGAMLFIGYTLTLEIFEFKKRR